jgi:hypothetical protein
LSLLSHCHLRLWHYQLDFELRHLSCF